MTIKLKDLVAHMPGFQKKYQHIVLHDLAIRVSL